MTLGVQGIGTSGISSGRQGRHRAGWRRVTATAATILLALGVSLVDASPATAAEDYNGYTLTEARWVIVNKTNAARTAKGLKPVTESTQLSTVSQNWSKKQASSSTMGHNPSYTTLMPSGWTRVAENVAYGQSVDKVVQAWLNSPGHYANIMNPQINTIGVGLAKNSNGAIYYTQNFGAYAKVPSPVTGPPPNPLGAAVNRVSGGDRYATAVAISKAGFPKSADIVYVATGADYPDALAAAPAAAKRGGPLLLTAKGSLPGAVKTELQRLKPARIIVVGGTGAVSAKVFTQLKSLAPAVQRLDGEDRFETSRRVIENAFSDGSAEAYVATGFNYPDALSASAAAGAIGAPVLLVDGKKLDKSTGNLLKSLKVTKVMIAGGTGAVSESTATALAKITKVQRFAGTDRFDTSQKINKAAFPTQAHTYLATGFQFPDALAGAALAGAKGAPLYVVHSGCVPGGMFNDIKNSGSKQVTLLGGTGALDQNVAGLGRC
ncbi:cell wall-binding repeat-containing protein [Homoserinimonas sp. OAct 916]|uniref:cell wall-binding repeat-containing protein n=1 Tax=Homoserinimonas sp. OAct 916 TaxID=2211450 RepID=UPI0018E4FEF1|nr:cell wall-binding repeat-containing protein [Homoserinimonas sp. OAct 916]